MLWRAHSGYSAWIAFPRGFPRGTEPPIAHAFDVARSCKRGIVMNRSFKLVLAGLCAGGAALASPSYAQAAHPKFSYCEIGPVYTNVDADGVSTLGPVTGDFDANDGFGYFAGCKIPLLLRIHAYAEARDTGFDVHAVISDPVLGDRNASYDGDQDILRFGAGWSLELPFQITGYAEAGFIFIKTDLGITGFGAPGEIFDPEDDDWGPELEVGGRWMIIDDFLEAGGFLRYVSEESIKFESSSGGIDHSSSWNPGLSVAVRAIGPLWVSGRWEFGDTDALLIGGRFAF